MEDTLKRRFFYDQAFAIYGGRDDEGAVVLLVTLLCLAKSLVCELISDCVRSHKGEKTLNLLFCYSGVDI